MRCRRTLALRRHASQAPQPSTAQPAFPEYNIDPDVLKELGHGTLELLGRHFARLPELPVQPATQPGEFAKRFPSQPPTGPTEFAKLLERVEKDILPGVTHWQHPRFMAYYPSSSSVPAILSETVIAALGAVGLQWSASPIATELEVVVMDWLAQLLGLEGDFLHSSGRGGGLMQNTAGEAIANVMVCARVRKHRQLQPELPWEEAFCADSSKLVVYMSDQTHFSGPKACRLAGLRVHVVPARRVQGNFRLCAQDLEEAIAADRAAGLVPCALQLNYGSTNTCGLDDIAEFSSLALQEDLWVHVDAAYAGPAWALPSFRADADAACRVATSVNVNGSKWFLCGFDTAFLWVRDRRLLTDVFSATDSFMAPEGDSIYSPEFKDWSVPLGRRFRSLRVWMVLEYFGTDGIKAFLQRAVDQADWLRARVDEHPALELAVETKLGLVVLRMKDNCAAANGLTIQGLAEHLQTSGFLVYPSQVEGSPVLRVALGGSSTRIDDVEALWNEVSSFCKTPVVA